MTKRIRCGILAAMRYGFWEKIPTPLFVMAPMANVTDAAFRRLFAKYGKPDVTWTEFVSVEGLLSAGREKLLIDFWYTEAERPIVAQVFGGKPEQFREVAKLIRELGFDGMDINMGCPDKGVERSGGGACLIKDPERAKAIIAAAKEGAGEMPVSVKTRIGYNRDELASWLPHLLEAEPAAITLHLRTRKEMSDVPAHWDAAAEAVALRDRHDASPQKTLILGNGDVMDLAEAEGKVRQYGVDGVMIGRGIFGNPWLFSKHVPAVAEKLRVMVEHTELFEELYGPGGSVSFPRRRESSISSHLDSRLRGNDIRRSWLKNFDVMKKHYKAYANGFDGAKELRVQLMEANNAADVRRMTEDFLAGFPPSRE